MEEPALVAVAMVVPAEESEEPEEPDEMVLLDCGMVSVTLELRMGLREVVDIDGEYIRGEKKKKKKKKKENARYSRCRCKGKGERYLCRRTQSC